MKKVVILIGTLLVLGIGWYLFVYPYNYVVRMQAKTFPAAITQTLKLWAKENSNMIILEQKGTESINMELSFGDSTHIYQWDIIPIHDSLSKINVYTKDKIHSFKNKIGVPFSDTPFKKRTEKTLKDFLIIITEHIENFRVGTVVEEQFKEKTCICTTRESSQLEKANGMMRDNPLLSGTILKYGLEPDGPPLIEITEWNKEAGLLKYNFCYPIKEKDTVLDNPEMFFREISSVNALKAAYNGNYITSDRAWYVLSNYAAKNNLAISGLPIEVFYNNPNLGGDALQWKAEIFMPLQDAR